MSIQPHFSFDTLTRVLEHLGSEPRRVRRAEAAADGDDDGSLRATVEVAIPVCEVATGTVTSEHDSVSASIENDGAAIALQFPVLPGLSAAELSETLPPGESVSTEATDAFVDDGDVVVSLRVVISSEQTCSTEESAVDTTSVESLRGEDQEGSDASSATLESAASTEVAASLESIASVGSDSGARPAESPPGAAVRDDSVPAYEDTPYLERLYETCETFAEMSRAIEMDVSAETVRRYMIDAGVHSPTSYQTTSERNGADGSSDIECSPDDKQTDDSPSEDATDPTTPHIDDRDESDIGRSATSLPDEQLIADGIGLPERVALHDVVDAVVAARTVHEVQRELDLPYDRTRQLLRQLNVLDLVLGRVAIDAAREVTPEDVTSRIRELAPDRSA